MTTDRNALRATLRQKFPRNRGQLLPALHFLHEEFGYLPDWAMELTGWHLGSPISEVYGAATSYTQLRTENPGHHIVRVCTGLSCWISGGREILEKLQSELRISAPATTPDDRVTLEEVPCTYMCGMAPVVELDGAYTGRASVDSIQGMFSEVAGI